MAERLSSNGFQLLAVAIGIIAGLSGRAAAADVLDQIRERGVIKWGGDENGGGPYVFPEEKDPNIPRGFEVELADALAKTLGVRAEFEQGDWEKVPELINAGRIDIALNGYELTPERQSRFLCSVPYYVYGFQLLVRTDSPIHSWADLERGKGRLPKIGALVGSAAFTYLQANTRLKVQAIPYDGTTDSAVLGVSGMPLF